MDQEVISMVLGIIEVVMTAAILSGSGYAYKQYKEHKAEHCDIRESQRDQLQYQIVMAFRIFNAQGFISLHEKQMFDNLCNRYYALGGNAFVHSLQEKINQLSIID